jgi:hypothetical protein
MTSGQPIQPELRAELLRRMEADQAARKALDASAMRAVDAENLPWLKQVIADVGWPGISVVGKDGAHAAWLLVQHADRDSAFQRHCLNLLTAAAEQGEAATRDVAYLTDRVLLHEGRQQEFGTQVTGDKDGRYIAKNLRDPDGVDERRAGAGLGPLAGYLTRIAESHGPPRPGQLKCPSCQTMIEFWPPAEGKSLSVTCSGCGRTMTVRIGGPPPGPSGLP